MSRLIVLHNTSLGSQSHFARTSNSAHMHCCWSRPRCLVICSPSSYPYIICYLQEWLTAFAAAATAILPTCTSEHLSRLVYGFGCLRFVPPRRFLARYFDQSVFQLDDFTSQASVMR